MLVREYVKQFNTNGNITFVKARARKDAHTPYYHPEYQTTPIKYVSEWEDSRLMDYIILNHRQRPIDWLTGANWGMDFDRGLLTCLLVISKEDLELLYRNEEQRERMIKYVEERIKE